MKSVKHLLRANSLDEKILEIIKEIIGAENSEIIKKFLDLYQIRAEVHGDILHIFMFFSHRKSFIKIAEHNLETGETKTLFPREKLIDMIIKENQILIEKAQKEFNRYIYLILSIIALILGGIFGYILFKTFQDI
ncbi:MAG: hypothetical protein GXO21_05740 [Aquificae bacterium]|nr:hypothetical protein [Aquificota bacterium]